MTNNNRYYTLEYFAAPSNQKYNVGLDVGEDPQAKGYEQKGCIDVAAGVGGVKAVPFEKKVCFTTPGKPYELVASTDVKAAALATALKECVESLEKKVPLTPPPRVAAPSAAAAAPPPPAPKAAAAAAVPPPTTTNIEWRSCATTPLGSRCPLPPPTATAPFPTPPPSPRSRNRCSRWLEQMARQRVPW